MTGQRAPYREDYVAGLPEPRRIPPAGPAGGLLWRIANEAGFAVIQLLTGSRLVSVDEGGVATLNEPGAIVLAANHNHPFDGTAVLMGLPRGRRRGTSVVGTIVMLRGWGRWPSLSMRLRGWFFTGLLVHAYGVAWVHDSQRGTEAVEGLAEFLRNGTSLLIFPSGELAYGATESEYRYGAVLAAQAAGVPIVPVRVDGVMAVLRRFVRLRLDAVMVVRYRTPIRVGPHADAGVALAALRAALAAPDDPESYPESGVWRVRRLHRVFRGPR